MPEIDPEAALRAATANVHAKAFDDEVVVLDMGTGTYFSLRGAAAGVWALIEQHASPTTIRGAFVGGDVEAIDDVLRQLLDARLVVSDETLPSRSTVVDPLPFEEPIVERYTDMQDLLLLDPIHDVDESGWPSTPA